MESNALGVEELPASVLLRVWLRSTFALPCIAILIWQSQLCRPACEDFCVAVLLEFLRECLLAC